MLDPTVELLSQDRRGTIDYGYTEGLQADDPIPDHGPPAASDIEHARRAAAEALSAAQETISVKGLIELRGRFEAPAPARAAVCAAACLVLGIDEAGEVDPDAASMMDWGGAMDALQKPGHFVNSLRRFPYAVDAGRLPGTNVIAASRFLEEVSPDELVGEVVVAHIHQWVLAAQRYVEVSVIAAEAGLLPSPTAPGHPVAPAGGMEAQGAPPLSPNRQVVGSPGRAEGAAAAPAGPPGARTVRSTAGSLGVAAGAGGVPTPRRQVRTSVGGGSTAGARTSLGSRTSQRPSTGGGPGGASAATAPSSGRTSLASSQPGAGMGGPRRSGLTSRLSGGGSVRGGAAGGGYPSAAQGQFAGVSVQDMRQQLEQLRNETRAAKAQEASLKASMRREDEKQKKKERDESRKEVLESRKQDMESTNQYIEEKRHYQKAVELQENREFQETKRTIKEVERQQELHEMHEDYAESKENAGYRVELRKLELAERQRAPIEENLEKFRVLAEHNLEEQRREEVEIREARMLAEAAEMAQTMAKAQKERELALQSLEYATASQGPVRQGAHLTARVK